MRFNHVIFDLDGTLADTEKTILTAWQQTMRDMGRDCTQDELRFVVGIPASAAMERLQIQNAEHFYERLGINYRAAAGETVLFEGVWDMLQTLLRQGRTLGIVTSRKRAGYNAYFKPLGLSEICALVLCADDTDSHKPDPGPLLSYKERIGAGKEECIYIGDMPTDIQCANAAGMASGLVSWNDTGVVCPDAAYTFNHPQEVCSLA